MTEVMNVGEHCDSPPMLKRHAAIHVAQLLIGCGYGMYIAALLSPAIEVSETIGALGDWQETFVGYQCLATTLNPLNWIFAPLLPFYLLANLLILGSLFSLKTRPSARSVLGNSLLTCAVVCLTSPWCYGGIQRVDVGCYLWIASFVVMGVGFIFSSAPRHFHDLPAYELGRYVAKVKSDF